MLLEAVPCRSSEGDVTLESKKTLFHATNFSTHLRAPKHQERRMTLATRPLGPVLVTGGCGFLGYHLVDRLLSDADADGTRGPVHVLDLDITRNTHPSATYTQGSVADPQTLSALLARVQPAVIFHAASPNATYGTRLADFHVVNVDGTSTLLRLAHQSPHVRAVIFTSTLDIYADPPHRHINETHPIWPDRPRPWAGVSEYDRTKAVAHRLVLAANTDGDVPAPASTAQGSLKTAIIVPSHMWGVRDSQGLSLFFDTFADPKKPLWQVGRGDNMMSSVEVGNCAMAHILAAKALLSPSSFSTQGKVDGEAFNVTDGEDVSFWGHFREVCTLIRHPNATEGLALKTSIVPAWVMVLVAALVKWALLLSTWGYVEPPPMLTRNGVSWCTEEHTIDDSKARERLGYRPHRPRPRREMLAEAVEWERERRRKAVEGEGEKKTL